MGVQRWRARLAAAHSRLRRALPRCDGDEIAAADFERRTWRLLP
jgi:hypothetical protein